MTEVPSPDDFKEIVITSHSDYAASAITTLANKNTVGMNVEHCLVGIGGELGELRDATKVAVFYKKDIQTFDLRHLDKVNVMEELGDAFWYISVLATVLSNYDSESYETFQEIMSKTAADTIRTDAELNRVAITCQKLAVDMEIAWYEQTKLDMDKFYLLIEGLMSIAQYLDIPLLKTYTRNINKLRLGRYKKGKFDDLAAMEKNRDRARERELLEA